MGEPHTFDIRPSKIRLEVSSRCQLRCPSCPTTSGAINPAIGTGVLRLADFRRLLDENPRGARSSCPITARSS